MKKGFSLYIQSDLTGEELNKAKSYLNSFISKTCADPQMRYFGSKGGGYTTGLWRGRYGIEIGDGLVFRRIANNSRKFAIVKSETLEVWNDSFLDKAHSSYRDLQANGTEVKKGCRCPRHLGSVGVRFKNGQKPAMKKYAEIGSVKG